MTMSDYSNANLDTKTSSMIALLPTNCDWSSVDLPHLTLVYSGEIADLEPTDFNKLAKDASSLAMMNDPLTLLATGVEIFGEDPDKVDVLRFQMNRQLEAMRHVVEGWDVSEYPFNPHVTLGPPGSHVLLPPMPRSVTFDCVYVGWGEQCLTFQMTANGY